LFKLILIEEEPEEEAQKEPASNDINKGD